MVMRAPVALARLVLYFYVPLGVTSLAFAQPSSLDPIASKVSMPAVLCAKRVPSETPPTDASTPDTLSLEEALGLAAERNPLLRGARATADASAGALMQAGAFPNPEISLLQEGFRGDERTTTALLNQKLELGNKRGSRLDIATHGREVALASLDGRAAALRADVIVAFYGLLAAQWQLEATRDAATIAARSLDLAQKRVRAGKVSPVDALKAKVAATGVEIELATLQAGIAAAREKLAAVSGSPLPMNRAAYGDLETLPVVAKLPELLRGFDDSPLVRQARAEVLRSDAVVALENARRLPDITVTAGVKRLVIGGMNDQQAVIGVSIPLPLFDSNQGAILEAARQADKARADLDNENAQWRLAITQAYSSYEGASQEARRLKDDALPAARESLDAMSRGFELGKFGFLEVLDAQRTLFEIRSRYRLALMRAHQAYADLGRLTGTPIRTTVPPMKEMQ
jgi:cobalt-zinc-cadmium efflux system outer membrane protein